MILLPLRPVSPMHENPQRCKIICGIRHIRLKDQLSIEIIVFLKYIVKKDFAVYTEWDESELYLKRAKSNLTEKCKKIAQK